MKEFDERVGVGGVEFDTPGTVRLREPVDPIGRLDSPCSDEVAQDDLGGLPKNDQIVCGRRSLPARAEDAVPEPARGPTPWTPSSRSSRSFESP
jgi:hypothetical protein